MQRALEEAEQALDTEEQKLQRAQLEVVQIKAEVERRVKEKEEEFENTRRNHQRHLESIQVFSIYSCLIFIVNGNLNFHICSLLHNAG